MDDKKWVSSLKWAIYALMGEISVEEIMTNGTLIDAFARVEKILKAL